MPGHPQVTCLWSNPPCGKSYGGGGAGPTWLHRCVCDWWLSLPNSAFNIMNPIVAAYKTNASNLTFTGNDSEIVISICLLCFLLLIQNSDREDPTPSPKPALASSPQWSAPGWTYDSSQPIKVLGLHIMPMDPAPWTRAWPRQQRQGKYIGWRSHLRGAMFPVPDLMPIREAPPFPMNSQYYPPHQGANKNPSGST